ncbi:YmfL family putative regulatory protein, partial [Klebsiella pneumoniae]
MKNESLKEVVKKMCCAMPGGREALAGALGMSLTTFNNNLYEKNGCRFFDNDELEAMEDLTKTRHLVEYHMDRHDITPMETIEPENIDEVELFKIQTNLSAHQGQLSELIKK